MASCSNDDLGEKFNILLLGKAGSGKSRTGNSILGDKNAFDFGKPTENCIGIKRERFGKNINVIDTPSDATLHPEQLRNISEYIEKDCFSVCIICLQIGRLSDEDLKTYTKYVECLDESLLNFSIVVFTNGDKWENDMNDKHIQNPSFNCYIEKLSDPGKALLHKCGDRFVMFNNKRQEEENDEQVKRLLTLVAGICPKNSKKAFPFEIPYKLKTVATDILKKSASTVTKGFNYSKTTFNKIIGYTDNGETIMKRANDLENSQVNE